LARILIIQKLEVIAPKKQKQERERIKDDNQKETKQQSAEVEAQWSDPRERRAWWPTAYCESRECRERPAVGHPDAAWRFFSSEEASNQIPATVGVAAAPHVLKVASGERVLSPEGGGEMDWGFAARSCMNWSPQHTQIHSLSVRRAALKTRWLHPAVSGYVWGISAEIQKGRSNWKSRVFRSWTSFGCSTLSINDLGWLQHFFFLFAFV
jgi:hypothetical protein